MSATYLPGSIDPVAGDPISAVRWLLQDTTTATAEITDEELQAILDIQSEATQVVAVYRTAAAGAVALHRRYAKQATFSSGGTSVQLGERAKYWELVAQQLLADSNLVEMGTAAMVLYGSRDSLYNGW